MTNPADWPGLIFENLREKQNFMCVGHWDKEWSGQSPACGKLSLET